MGDEQTPAQPPWATPGSGWQAEPPASEWPTAPPQAAPPAGYPPVPPGGYPSYGYPPAGPPRRRSRVPLVLSLVAGLVVLAVGATAFVVVSGDEDSSGDTDPTSSAAGELAEVPASFTAFTDADEGYRISLPGDWVATALHGDTTGLGDEMFPDDPDRAELFDQSISVVPRLVIFVAMNPAEMDGRQFVSNINLVRQDPPAGVDLDDVVDQSTLSIEGIGGTIGQVTDAATTAGPATRVEYELTGPGIHGLQYYIGASGDVWILTFTTDDMEAYEADFVVAASSFELLG